MKRLNVVPFLPAILFSFSLAQPLGAQDKVLMVVKDAPSLDLELMLTQEVTVMKKMLEASGFNVVVASPSGGTLTAGGISLTPDLRLADVRMDDYSGIILPCMATEDEPSVPETEALVREAVVAGKPVAAQTGSVVTLARAGILMGRKFAYADAFVADVPEFQGLTHAGQGIVQDGVIITSGVCPYAARELGLTDGTPALTGALIAQLW
jgi:putative intracellular protease/amidase